jgi:hypothetical protein
MKPEYGLQDDTSEMWPLILWPKANHIEHRKEEEPYMCTKFIVLEE